MPEPNSLENDIRDFLTEAANDYDYAKALKDVVDVFEKYDLLFYGNTIVFNKSGTQDLKVGVMSGRVLDAESIERIGKKQLNKLTVK